MSDKIKKNKFLDGNISGGFSGRLKEVDEKDLNNTIKEIILESKNNDYGYTDYIMQLHYVGKYLGLPKVFAKFPSLTNFKLISENLKGKPSYKDYFTINNLFEIISDFRLNVNAKKLDKYLTGDVYNIISLLNNKKDIYYNEIKDGKKDIEMYKIDYVIFLDKHGNEIVDIDINDIDYRNDVKVFLKRYEYGKKKYKKLQLKTLVNQVSDSHGIMITNSGFIAQLSNNYCSRRIHRNFNKTEGSHKTENMSKFNPLRLVDYSYSNLSAFNKLYNTEVYKEYKRKIYSINGLKIIESDYKKMFKYMEGRCK